MPITAKLDEFGKPAWVVLIVLGFIAWVAHGGVSVPQTRSDCGRRPLRRGPESPPVSRPVDHTSWF